MTHNELWHRLTTIYDAGEAKAIVRWVLDVRFGMSVADIYSGKVTELSAEDQAELEKIMRRLEKAEPVQYVLGTADFCGRQFHVEPGVLIPRPETAELCRWIAAEHDAKCPSPTILDIGTGSGCIAITLALDLPESNVTAWDISDEALRIAKGNAEALGAKVTFEHQDALRLTTPDGQYSAEEWDIIVSNPPYIDKAKESDEMERNVLDHEPHEALFAPEGDATIFYRHIAAYATHSLKPGGQLYFELNPLTADEVNSELHRLGFKDTEIRMDAFGKKRFLKATKA